ncbi:TonB-dependent receptor [Spirosoma aerophilum]
MIRLLILLLLITSSLFAQNTFVARVLDAKSKTPLPGATVQIKTLKRGAVANGNGIITITDLPSDEYEIEVRFIGYKEVEKEYEFPLKRADTLTFLLSPVGEELGEITVSTTRSSRTISDIPTRIEVISAGELDEKVSGQPSNIRTLLSESTGIQTQQTSPTSANTTLRIQGLDGRYTQLMQDGFPLYSGFASGLSILQIPPLNLRRVEVLKGASSTLYGGGAIAGLINLITKEPTAERELTFLANYNQTQALDLSGFYSQRFGKIGLTLYTARNIQRAYDVNQDGFSDIPKFERYTLSPKLFYYLNPTTTISLGVNTSFENRLGGDMQVIAGQSDNIHSYFERNQTNRISTQFRFDKTFTNQAVLTLKNSVSWYTRALTRPSYMFDGQQTASFSEISYSRPNPVFEWVIGGNLWTDQFTQKNAVALPLNYALTTVGAFAQSNWKPLANLVLETGLRTDYTSRNAFLVLPRVSVLYKFSPHLTSRIGGGLGYRSPTPFTDESETLGFQTISPLNFATVHTETSLGGNADITYRTLLFETINLSVNQLFFYTRLNNPTLLNTTPDKSGQYVFYSAAGYLDSKGFETNIKFTYDELALYLGYTYTDAKTYASGTIRQNPFTSKNRLYTTLLYEIEPHLRLGYELFYIGQQTIRDGDIKQSYWVMGVSAEYKWKHFSVFANAENFTDARQSRFEPSYTGSFQNPQFNDIWAPTDGFIFNAGFKLMR